MHGMDDFPRTGMKILMRRRGVYRPHLRIFLSKSYYQQMQKPALTYFAKKS